MPHEPSPIARQIQKIREARKLTRQQLAEELGTTYLRIYRIETGRCGVSVRDVPRFASVLEVNAETLYRALFRKARAS